MGLPSSRFHVVRLALLFACAAAPCCEKNEATERRADGGTARSAPSRASASPPVVEMVVIPPLPPEQVVWAKDSELCEELRRCFAEKLPKKYEPAMTPAVEAGIRTCQGTRSFSNVEKCIPYEFGRDARNGFTLEVRGRRTCHGCVCGSSLTFGYHFDSDEECVCQRTRAGQPAASRDACYDPDEPPALVPKDEIRLSADAGGAVHVEEVPLGGRLWYLGFAPVFHSRRGAQNERVLTINGTVPSTSDAAGKLLGGPLSGLRRIDVMRGAELHSIAYVDRAALDELFAELDWALAEGWPQKACLDVRQSTEITIRTHAYAFDDSCKDPVTVRLTKLVERVLHLVDKPRRRPVGPLSCSALEKHPISLKVQTRTQFVELRAIDWWSGARARVRSSSVRTPEIHDIRVLNARR